MDRDKNWIAPADLPFDRKSLEREYGPIEQAELKCPGVYHLRAAPPPGRHRTIHNGVYWIETDRCVPALMNAVWERFPEYAAAHNMLEQQGLNDGFGLMLRALSIPGGLHSFLDNMIAMTPGAGVRFLKFL